MERGVVWIEGRKKVIANLGIGDVMAEACEEGKVEFDELECSVVGGET